MNEPRPILSRGLIEVSNACEKDCLYCGVRRSNVSVRRYCMSMEGVRACCDEARRRGYPAVAFQAGEIESEANTRFYEEACRYARDRHGFEITLSLGEQTEDVYRRWKDAGAMKYLIRIETSNRELYARLHPASCSYDRRLECIRTLKRLGYVTGSGVMIGLPGQTKADLERDLDFFERERLDMVGMGPYVPTAGTPLGDAVLNDPLAYTPAERMELALWMIAETRRRMPRINIVAASALDALDPAHGRARGIAAGANVVMPNLTPVRYAADYSLYPGKR